MRITVPIGALLPACTLVLAGALPCRPQTVAHPQPAQRAPRVMEEILDFHSDVTLHEDATLEVTETVTVVSAGSQIRHGIYREFPTRYTDSLNHEYVVGFQMLSATCDSAATPFRVENYANGKRIYLGDPKYSVQPGRHLYTLTYTTNRQLGFFPDHDELFWNVTGNGWVFQIDQASASIHLPARIPVDQVRLGGYTGPQGSMSQDLRWTSQPDGSFEFTTYGPLPPKSGLTILMMWPKGYFAEPTFRDKARFL